MAYSKTKTPQLKSAEYSPRRPVATYSIVARDPQTGQMGIAVQSHFFSVGPIVAWAEAGVGAIATQSLVDPAYGPLGLDMMRMGKTAEEALQGILASDKGSAGRQVAMVDAEGNIATHTGDKGIAAAGHQTGEQYSVQANMMDKDTVWGAMAAAYESSDGDLAERLLSALEAAEAEGGDIRGKQSAAILIVGPENTGKPWIDQLFDLRVEDHPDPVGELRRLVTLQRAYNHFNEGDEHLGNDDMASALVSYHAALKIVPDEATQGEIPFWVGVTMASLGKVDEAIPYLIRGQRQHDRWIDLLPRLVTAGILPDEEGWIDRLIKRVMDEMAE
ncbi:MAG: putative Ntn-hydrolase superfamily protein [Cellvibrionaceae bacterium]|jgi:uncharacterized Ntn-hydrolase superfamily protein